MYTWIYSVCLPSYTVIDAITTIIVIAAAVVVVVVVVSVLLVVRNFNSVTII